MVKALAIIISKKINGIIRFEQLDQKLLKIKFDIRGFEPCQTHAIHIHEYGDLSNGCASLGAHFNPDQKLHSQHAGDLFNNLVSDSSGSFKYEYITDRLSLLPDERNIYGRSVVIHKYPDDLGLQGLQTKNGLIRYSELDEKDLRYIYKLLYGDDKQNITQKQILKKLNTESFLTGNASTRIAYGIIVHSK
jgi:Cu-Zn family superoxide dismutase